MAAFDRFGQPTDYQQTPAAQSLGRGNSSYSNNTAATQPQQQQQPAQQPPQSTRDQIMALYKQYGVNPGASGSGFTDINYWSNAADKTGGWSPYWNNRLGGDLAGNGPDVQSGGGSGGTLTPPSGTPLTTSYMGNFNVNAGARPSFTQPFQNEMTQAGSLSPQVQAQMQGQLKDQALAMQKSNDSALRQQYADSGINTNSPALAAQLAQSALGTQSNLLNQYRNLGAQAAEQNWGDINNVNQAATQLSLQGRGQDIQSQLGGQSLNLQQLLGMTGLNNQYTLGQEGMGLQYGLANQNNNNNQLALLMSLLG